MMESILSLADRRSSLVTVRLEVSARSKFVSLGKPNIVQIKQDIRGMMVSGCGALRIRCMIYGNDLDGWQEDLL